MAFESTMWEEIQYLLVQIISEFSGLNHFSCLVKNLLNQNLSLYLGYVDF